ncbi:UNVERIFIED_ORG: hypothetical protein ABIB13_003279 [Arthrobacter sp. UYEF2]
MPRPPHGVGLGACDQQIEGIDLSITADKLRRPDAGRRSQG